MRLFSNINLQSNYKNKQLKKVAHRAKRAVSKVIAKTEFRLYWFWQLKIYRFVIRTSGSDIVSTGLRFGRCMVLAMETNGTLQLVTTVLADLGLFNLPTVKPSNLVIEGLLLNAAKNSKLVFSISNY